ncbi:MAG TPA: ATP-binding protein [Egibacteraceae bacterium]|nr:ATP-binding protein [Egibacteraceae bacterium]
MASVPATVPELRRVLRRWLAHNGAVGDAAYDITIAFAEACTNAVQHAYHGGHGAIDVEAVAQEGEILITIRDYGTWKLTETGDSDDGGRGLQVMQGLMDNVEVASNVDGTEVRMRRGLDALMVPS